jgi:hypothetical protein
MRIVAAPPTSRHGTRVQTRIRVTDQFSRRLTSSCKPARTRANAEHGQASIIQDAQRQWRAAL